MKGMLQTCYHGLAAICAICVIAACSSDGDFVSPEDSQPGPSQLTSSVVSLDITKGTVEQSNPAANSSGTIRFIGVDSATVSLSNSDAVSASGTSIATSEQTPGKVFLMSHELTQGQWRTLVSVSGAAVADQPWATLATGDGFGGSSTDADDRPAFALSHQDIQTVLGAFNALGGYQLHLPTGAEWEWACRAGSGNERYVWGDTTVTATVASYALTREVAENASTAGVEVGGARNANAFGFYDMHGNVWEWVSNGGAGGAPCLRGGSWADNVAGAQFGNRMDMSSTIDYGTAGVRLVITIN